VYGTCAMRLAQLLDAACAVQSERRWLPLAAPAAGLLLHPLFLLLPRSTAPSCRLANKKGDRQCYPRFSVTVAITRHPAPPPRHTPCPSMGHGDIANDKDIIGKDTDIAYSTPPTMRLGPSYSTRP